MTDTVDQALVIDGLTISYPGSPAAVSGLDLRLEPGEIIGVIGESGCGKSSLGLALLGLLPASTQVSARRMEVAGHDYIGLGDAALQEIRGEDVSMVFQEPMNALNPVMRIGDQIAEVLRLHGQSDRKRIDARVLELLRLVQVPEPQLRVRQFPHQISGGMRQRVVIAIAMAAEPRVLVADEPTTALDVTVQAQILALLADLRDRTGTAIVLISHDLGVIARVCDRVVVMYAGEIIEAGHPRDVLRSPGHPYTQGLLASIPSVSREPRAALPAIPGGVTTADRSRTGCRFAGRCSYVEPECHEPQPLFEVTGRSSQQVRCLLTPRRETSSVEGVA
ncbi:MAG: ABC transporter ATP-binding protein [Nocardioides sp.]|uniref:ABC transporter ATP-binding protein n=1 Tax=Nocardioides sp. TaxID=35761 RepID=UPI0039E5E433